MDKFLRNIIIVILLLMVATGLLLYTIQEAVEDQDLIKDLGEATRELQERFNEGYQKDTLQIDSLYVGPKDTTRIPKPE